MNMVMHADKVAIPGSIYPRMLPQCGRCCFYNDIIERYFYTEHTVYILTRIYGIVHVYLHGKIIMRGSELAFTQAPGNGFAHLRNSNILVTFFGNSTRHSCRASGNNISFFEPVYITFNN